jgi:hypothetical protein
VKLNPKQKAAIKSTAAKLVAMDEASLENVEEALEQALEEVQAVADDPQTDPGADDAEGANAEVVGLLKQVLAKLEGAPAAADADKDSKEDKDKAAAAMDAKIKAAADSAASTARASIEDRFRAAEKVAPITGRIDAMAFDSAEKIFAHALTVGGMKPDEHKPEAYAGIVDVLIANHRQTPVHAASDSKTAGELQSTFAGLSKIRFA